MLEEEELKDAILLVFANKQDSKGALNSRHVHVKIHDLDMSLIIQSYRSLMPLDFPTSRIDSGPSRRPRH